MRRKTSASLLYLIFVFSVAKGGSWVERLVIGKDYGPDCNARVTCHVHSEDTFVLIKWTSYGGPYEVRAMNQIPNLRMGEVRSVRLYEYRQSVTLYKCYSKLALTCEIGGSSKTVTLTSGVSWVKRLDIDEDYGSDCNAKLTCHVHSEATFVSVRWKCVGDPCGVVDINQIPIPGLKIGDLRSVEFNEYKQSVAISKCYSKLALTCEIGGFSRTVTLTSSKGNQNDSDQKHLAKMKIFPISLGVIFVVSLISGCIRLARSIKRTQGAVVGGFVNPMTNPIEPTYPAQPIPAGNTEYPNPPPYQEVMTEKQNLP